MTAKHTPGPWNVYPVKTEENCYELWDEHDNYHPNVSEQTKESNARLMGAAPELLEACKLAYARLLDLAPGDHEYLKNAIHKAEGRK